MFTLSSTPAFSTKTELYDFLLEQTQALIGNEHDFIANTANLASLLWYNLPQINWVGFYRLKPEGLVLGPFQGKPACIVRSRPAHRNRCSDPWSAAQSCPR